jgi:hypothetical protein
MRPLSIALIGDSTMRQQMALLCMALDTQWRDTFEAHSFLESAMEGPVPPSCSSTALNVTANYFVKVSRSCLLHEAPRPGCFACCIVMHHTLHAAG